MITGMQIRMARAALRWRIDDLADSSEIAWARLQTIEKTDDVPSVNAETLAKIRAVFEQAGIVFINGPDGAGVLLKA